MHSHLKLEHQEIMINGVTDLGVAPFFADPQAIPLA